MDPPMNAQANLASMEASALMGFSTTLATVPQTLLAPLVKSISILARQTPVRTVHRAQMDQGWKNSNAPALVDSMEHFVS